MSLRSHERRSLELDLLGCAVRVESSDEALIDGLTRCFARQGRSVRHGAWDLEVFVEVSGDGKGTDGSRHEVRSIPEGELDPPEGTCGPFELCSALNSWAALRATPFYVFHAGAAARDDRAVLLPGASFSGKSTLTAGLLRRGFVLLSDEIGAVEMSTNRMRAYPRCLSLRSDVAGFFGLAESEGFGTEGSLSRMLPPEAFGSARAVGAPELALVVAPRYRPATGVHLERLTPGAAVVALMECSVTHRRLKAKGLDWVIALVGRTPVYRLEFSSLGGALDAIERTWEEAVRTI